MKKKRVLYISQEITPYLKESPMSSIGRHLPQGIQENGKEIRAFMPKYGCINERRNQLHEVIRLSGMNLIIDEMDHPLIIKVASIQPARMQVYFIDNEDFFQRKAVLEDKEGNFFEDNDERAIFFSRGVLETVKKLGWAPDLIHCHGWMTSLIPMYLKTSYKDEPLFENAKVVYSLYNDDFKGKLNEDFNRKSLMSGVSEAETKGYEDPSYENVSKAAMDYSDAVIIGCKDANDKLCQYAKKSDKPFMEHPEKEDYIKEYNKFYDEVLEKDKVLAE